MNAPSIPLSAIAHFDPNVAKEPSLDLALAHALVGTHWPTAQEGLLQAILNRVKLPTRSTEAQWESVAADLNHASRVCGYPIRTGSACRTKAQRMGIRGHAKSVLVAAPLAAQGTFGSVEAKLLIADVLDRIAKELRGA